MRNSAVRPLWKSSGYNQPTWSRQRASPPVGTVRLSSISGVALMCFKLGAQRLGEKRLGLPD